MLLKFDVDSKSEKLNRNMVYVAIMKLDRQKKSQQITYYFSVELYKFVHS
jgi:hypothetical protein